MRKKLSCIGKMLLLIVGNTFLAFHLMAFYSLILPNFNFLFVAIIMIILSVLWSLGDLLPLTKFSAIIKKIGEQWMGISYYTTIAVLLFDLSILLSKSVKWIADFNVFYILLTGAFLHLAVIGVLIYGFKNSKNVRLKGYTVKTNKLVGQNNLSIAMISDIHLTYNDDKKLENIVAMVNSLNADLLLIAGDVFGTTYQDSKLCKDNYSKIFSKLETKYGVYACLGNHDSNYDGSVDCEIEQFFNHSNITLLRDKGVQIEDKCFIYGRDDNSFTNCTRKKCSEIGQLNNNDYPVIVIDHKPDQIEELVSNGADLVVCGHTHKGQIFPFNLITKLSYRYNYGHFNINGKDAVVSSGAGAWGPRLRIGSYNEITFIKVKHTDKMYNAELNIPKRKIANSFFVKDILRMYKG